MIPIFLGRQPELQFAGRRQADNGQYIQTGKDRIVKKRESGAALLTKRALRGRLCIRDVQPFPQIPNPEELTVGIRRRTPRKPGHVGKNDQTERDTRPRFSAFFGVNMLTGSTHKKFRNLEN